MMRTALRVAAFVFGLGIALPSSWGDDASKRIDPGHSMQLNGQTLDVSAPVYAPPTGNYSVLYSGSANPHQATDDFAILDCGTNNSAAVTYTFPAISSSVFPNGHQATIKNTSTSFLCTVTASTSTITGAPGVTSGNPAASGGPVTLYPGGEVTLVSDGTNYKAFGFIPGTWYQFANNVASLSWTGLSGYPELDLHCSGIIPATSGDSLGLREAYSGTFQATGYNAIPIRLTQGFSSPSFDANQATAFQLTGSINNPGDGSNGAGATIQVHLTFANSTGSGYANAIISNSRTFSFSGAVEAAFNNAGAAPYSVIADPVTGIQLLMFGGANITSGLCWLKPSL